MWTIFNVSLCPNMLQWSPSIKTTADVQPNWSLQRGGLPRGGASEVLVYFKVLVPDIKRSLLRGGLLGVFAEGDHCILINLLVLKILRASQ